MADHEAVVPGAVNADAIPLNRILAICLGLMALFCCLVIGLVTYGKLAAGIREQMFNQLETIRDEKVERLNVWIEERVRDVETWSSLGSIVGICEDWQAGSGVSAERRAYVESLRVKRGYDEVEIVDPVKGSAFLATPEVQGKGFESNPAGLESLLREKTVRVSDVHMCPEHRRPEITLACPIFSNTSGAVIGILIFRCDISRDIYSVILASKRIGKTGEIVLVNHAGIAQAPLKFSEGAVGSIKIDFEPGRLAASGMTGHVTSEDYHGEPAMAAYGYVSRLQWGIVVKEGVEEIEEPIYTMARDIMLFSLLAMVCAIMLGIFIARKIAEPAMEIAMVARCIGKGEHSLRVREVGPLELRRIARNINRMVETLNRLLSKNQALGAIYMMTGRHNRLDTLSREMLPLLMELTRSQSGGMYIAANGKNSLEYVYSSGLPRDRMPSGVCVEPPDSLIAQAAAAGKVLVYNDIPEENGMRISTQAGEVQPRALLFIPIHYMGTITGVIALASLYDYRQEDVEIAEALSVNFGQTIAACRANEETWHMAQELQAANEELEAANEELIAQSEELQGQTQELRESAAELDLQRMQLKEADRLKSEFLSNMSHEIRTPLNSILTLSQLMLARGLCKKPEQDAGYLQLIERNGRQLLGLINDILDLSKIEAGCLDVAPQHFNVEDLMLRVTETVRHMAEEKGLTFTTNTRDIPPVYSDRDRIHQILLNLLSNAVKFTRQGGVHVEAFSLGGRVIFEVRDTGIGIPESEQAFVFDQFRQVDGSTTREYGGTGLGLAISRKLAVLLGGSISVSSKPGEGSTFTLNLPMEYFDPGDAAALPLPAGRREPTVRGPASFSSPETSPRERPLILVVEDNEIAVLQIRSILEELHYRVVVAGDGQQALDYLSSRIPDAVILDLMIPVIDGFGVLERIRGDAGTSRVPVLVLTAKELSLEDRRRLFRENIQQLVRKGSIDRNELFSSIRNLLEKSIETAREDSRNDQEGKARPDSASDERDGISPASDSRDPVILVVEDHPDNLVVISGVLDEFGYRYVSARDGREAMEKAREDTPSLILMDIQLPGMSGLEVAAKMKEMHGIKNVPIVALTAKAMRGDRERILSAGCDDYLAKPFDPAELGNIIAKWLGKGE